MEASFLAVWYVLGMLISAGAGALLGRRSIALVARKAIGILLVSRLAEGAVGRRVGFHAPAYRQSGLTLVWQWRGDSAVTFCT